MVDYENISGSNGLMGINYLLPSDSLHLFYSEFCKKIRREHIEAIEKSSTVDILEAYKNIKNNNKLRSDIETMLPHVTNSISSVEVIDFVHRTNGFSMKQIYTDSLHTFGRENGVRIYRFLKEVI